MGVIGLGQIDVTCGECGGQLSIGPDEGSAACPHCGATLRVPEHCISGSVLTAAPKSENTETGSSIHAAQADSLSNIVVPSSIKGPDFRQWAGVGDDVDSSSSNSSVAIAPPVIPPAPTTSEPESASEPSPAPVPEMALEAKADSTATPRESTDSSSPVSASRETRSSRRGTRNAADDSGSGVSRTAFLGLVIYASIMTALCLGLAFLVATSGERQLESLPDVVPKMNEDGEIARVIVPADAELPPGHHLQLGESQRFGDLLVTPLRVTREPLTFTHYLGKETREPAGEVLKLWVRFENVDEEGPGFTPLDRELLFYRVPGLGPLKANNFLAEAGGESGELTPVYDHPLASDWDLTGQALGTVLAPGESWETFAPSVTDVPDLEGTWVWRLHLRKGIASNGWGVTTLVEIEFDADDVEA